MKMTEVCKHDVACVTRAASLSEAASLMRERHVGCVVVVDSLPSGKPVGIITDRDMVIEVLAAGIDPLAVVVRDIMSAPLFTAREDEDIEDVLRAMRIRGVRRVPVIDAQGCIAGIVSLDELIDLAGDTLQHIVGLLGAQHRNEIWARSARMVPHVQGVHP